MVKSLSGHVVKWSCGQVVKWSCGQVVMWSSGHVVKWSSGQVVKWSIETQIIMSRPTRFSPHVSDNIKDAPGLSRDICSQSGTSIQALLYILGALRCMAISMYNRSRVHPEDALTKSKWRHPCER